MAADGISDEEKFTLTSRDFRVPPGGTVLITSRPQQRAGTFYWRHFVIDRPECWNVIDLKIGNYSLFPSGDVIAASRLHTAKLQKRGCRTAEDFSIEVIYIGDDPDGEVFTCDILGEST